MHILISNDDGFDAPGIAALVQALKEQHHKVSVAAPRHNMSGCGMSMSLRKTIDVEELEQDMFVITGTPVDCIYLGLQSLTSEPVDLVISGINNGANLADDVLYSGTFAAAMEARHLFLPSIALSMSSHEVQHYETAAYVATQMANELPRLEYKSLLSVLNVNVPDVPMSDLRGFKATVLGQRLMHEKPVELEADKLKPNQRQFTLGLAGDFDRRKHKVMADFEAVEQGFVSVTPFSSQFENRAYINDTQTWLDGL